METFTKKGKNHVEICLVHACSEECSLPYQFKGQTLDCAGFQIDFRITWNGFKIVLEAQQLSADLTLV